MAIIERATTTEKRAHLDPKHKAQLTAYVRAAREGRSPKLPAELRALLPPSLAQSLMRFAKFRCTERRNLSAAERWLNQAASELAAERDKKDRPILAAAKAAIEAAEAELRREKK